ncbi:MAG: DUF512 domain-containing protein [Armatimonadetes bacterium]|nr:DUF512 domain-containing protein [Armatimonadota bacterium]MDE2207630.1 DUF512 domain-containing protein [Armatimonadota bacterium]
MKQTAHEVDTGLLVSAVRPHSPAFHAGVRPGDLLLSIDGHPIHDVLDFRFHAAEQRLQLALQRGAERLEIVVQNVDSADAGLEFEQDLGDGVHTCDNRCVFCFIHQMPKKMRKPLYLMDDDFRLSFMHGNYVTLTNLSDTEWTRILEQRLSPLYVSVHATEPALRGTLLGRGAPTAILPQLRMLADAGIDVHAQIVLCPGLNDGDHLRQTIEELAEEHPAASGKRCGVLSTAIVPVGLTRFRRGLAPVEHVEHDYAGGMIAAVSRMERALRRRLGTRFAWLADEWYFLAGAPWPGRRHYEAFPQLEDGIGTVRLFLDDAKNVSRRLPDRAPRPVQATLVTAEMAAGIVTEFAARLNRIADVSVNVCTIKNGFFGGDIRIAGLLTATDIILQVRQFRGAHEQVVAPKICLRADGLFLDDLTPADVSAQLGRPLVVSGNRPSDLCVALGLLPQARAAPISANRWLMEPGA